ncbi:MAG: dihydroorotase [Methanomassiliicoccaceae archaeon]|nr:dihydroorotase [Methanomassiliicoccaceae archaeon]
MLVIEGRIFCNGELINGAIGIEDGKIVDVKKVLKGDKRMDMGDRMILPGAVDPHVHFRDPGMTHKEDFTSGSMAALHGGVTCVLDMPNTVPSVLSIRELEDKKRTIRGRSFVDYGLYAALTPGCDAEKLAPKVPGFKLFMGSTTGKILVDGDHDIHNAMRSAASAGKTVSVHAEDESMIRKDEEKNNRDHLRNRPASAEYNAINRLSAYKGMKINICHITDASSVALAASLGFTMEVTTHHMFLHDLMSDSAELKVNPPLRDKNTQEGLFKAFMEGKITMLGTDHAPHTIDEKRRTYDEAPSGIPGVETYMPMMMHMVKKGEMSINHLVKMSSSAPAEIFGMNKGSIEIGKDADLVIYDMRKIKKIRTKDLHSKAAYTPYEGRDAIFPDTVIVRGEIQLKDGELCGDMIGADMYE